METVGLHPPARGLALPARAAPLGRSALGVQSGEPPLPVLVPCRALVDARGRPSTRWRGGWLASSTTSSTMSPSVSATTPANWRPRSLYHARERCRFAWHASSCQTRRPSSDTPDCQWRTSSQSKSRAGHRSCRPAALRRLGHRSFGLHSRTGRFHETARESPPSEGAADPRSGTVLRDCSLVRSHSLSSSRATPIEGPGRF
jgi:hypothetical protein